MRHRDWRLCIEDIISSINEIQEYTKHMDFDGFCRDARTVKAVLYCLATIGEAARHIPSDIKKNSSEIPWREMGDFRNIVIHEYFGVDLNIVWKTICYDLPPLILLMKQLLTAEILDQ